MVTSADANERAAQICPRLVISRTSTWFKQLDLRTAEKALLFEKCAHQRW